jgi:hypothetical protein
MDEAMSDLDVESEFMVQRARTEDEGRREVGAAAPVRSVQAGRGGSGAGDTEIGRAA